MKIATLITICVVAAIGSTAGSAAKPPPRLVTVSTAPLALKGTGFKARESVRLVVTAGMAKARRILRASATGGFNASFPTVSVDRCTGGTVRAIGSQGSSAVTKLGPLAQCPPAP